MKSTARGSSSASRATSRKAVMERTGVGLLLRSTALAAAWVDFSLALLNCNENSCMFREGRRQMAVDVVVKAKTFEDLIEQLGESRCLAFEWTRRSAVRPRRMFSRPSVSTTGFASWLMVCWWRRAWGTVSRFFAFSSDDSFSTSSARESSAWCRARTDVSGSSLGWSGSLMSHSRRGIVFPIERSRVSRSHPWSPTSQSKC